METGFLKENTIVAMIKPKLTLFSIDIHTLYIMYLFNLLIQLTTYQLLQ